MQLQNGNSFDEEKNDKLTYINGQGFVNSINHHSTISLIRGNSNVICFCVMLYYLLSKALILPSTYFIYMCGGDIQINFYTGLIVANHPIVKLLTLFFAQGGAIFVSCMLCFIANSHQIIAAKIFKKPHSRVTSLAVPMTISIGIVGILLGHYINLIFARFGIVFSDTVMPISRLDITAFYGLCLSLIFAVMQEILFRGVVLTSLRRFGDGFAIIATSLLFAVWSGGAVNLVSSFFLALPLCYFTIRSGSVLTAIITRIFHGLLLFLLRVSAGTLESSLAEVITLLTFIIIAVFSAYCFIVFIKADKAAFRVKPAKDNVKLIVKIGVFSTSVVFIFFAASQIMNIITTSQFIG